MRVLVVGAGATGGYFGGRLLEAGRDVTFLVRERRAAQLDAAGLVLNSPFGDVTLRSPPRVMAGGMTTTFDLVIVSCKAYDLVSTLEAFAPAVGPATTILPLLNGMRHIDDLITQFGADRVLGGHCMISAVLGADGAIAHLNNLHIITFGELSGASSDRVTAIAELFAHARFTAQVSTTIVQEMWEKWTFIAAVGCINSMMRAAIGDIVAAGAADLGTRIYDECCAIAKQNGHAPRAAAVEHTRARLTDAGSLITASLLKDIERGGPTEAEHIVGDLFRRGGADERFTPLLRVAYSHLRAYEIRRAREAAAI